MAVGVASGFASTGDQWMYGTTTPHEVLQSNTPTLFFHGGGNRYHAEAQMGQAAENAGVTTSVIRAMGLKRALQEFVVDS
nr:hypothetical protein [Lactiplantibacillus plantarum]